MIHALFAASRDWLSWPVIGAIFAISGAWDCYTGEVKVGRFFEFDKYDSVGPYVIIVGLKFVIAILIFTTMGFGAS